MRDRLDRAEKRGLIEDTQILIQARTLRNLIAHEYVPEALQELFGQLMETTPALLKTAENTIKYCSKYAI